MTRRTMRLLLALALAAPVNEALADHEARKCRAHNDSVPTSLGATRWAAVDGPVTGGCGAAPPRVFDVHTRKELVDALTKGNYQGDRKKENKLDHRSKIIYLHGTIDLNVDDANVPLREEDYMRMCNYTAHATYYDPVTGDQTGSGGRAGFEKQRVTTPSCRGASFRLGACRPFRAITIPDS